MLGIFDYETIREEEGQNLKSSSPAKIKTSFTSLQYSLTDSFNGTTTSGGFQRKRKPLKSISNKDESPGFTFKISGTSSSSLDFQFCPSTLAHNIHHASIMFREESNSKRRLSSSCFNIIQSIISPSGSATPKTITPNHTPNHTPKPRQRAQSLTVGSLSLTVNSKRSSQNNSNRRSSVSITSILQSCRSSVTCSEDGDNGVTTPPSSQEASSAAHGILTHLIPNSFLQTTSRRTSTHTSVQQCSCSSCGSTITPYWRDGWSKNVMLCNACGLRYQKFATRCPECRYIPRKEDGLGGNCIKCHTPWHVGPEDSSIRGTGYNPSGLLI